MSNRPVFLLLLLMLMDVGDSDATDRRLELGKADWKINSTSFHLSFITDERKNKGAVGTISGSRSGTLVVWPSVSEGISAFLEGSVVSDSATTAPFELVIERLRITDAVSGNRHSVSMDFLFKMVREIDGQRTAVFEYEVKPRLTATGQDAPAGYYESPLKEALRKFLLDFERWADQNRLTPLFMNHISVRFANDDRSTGETEGDTIGWTADYRLNWSDFRGKHDGISPFSAQSNCVYTFRTIPEFKEDTLVLIEDIRPCFTRKASWVRTDALQDTLLLHEQLHFDLCELYARRFRKELSGTSLGLSDYDQQVNRLFNQMWNDYRKRQERYDLETSHGTISEEQIRWINEIRAELDGLDAWATGK